MTYQEILTQVLSETTGMEKESIKTIFEKAKVEARKKGARTKLDDELPKEEAEKLLNDLRKDKKGILAWLVQGGIKCYQEQERLASNN
jgi:hypothetical protein